MALAKDSDGILSAFRGLARGEKSGDEPKSAQAFIDKIFLDCHIGKTSPLKAVLDAWNDIVPQRFLGLSEPVDIGASVLYVRSSNSAVKQELIFEEKKILRQVALLGGCSKIRKIKFL